MNNELDHKILAYALKEKKFIMELTNSVNTKYFVPELQWLFDFVAQYFSDPKFKEIPTKNVLVEYLDKEYTDQSFIQQCESTFDEIHSQTPDPAEFNWYLDKLRVRYNTQIQKEATSNIVKLFKSAEETDRLDKVNKLFKETVVGIDSIYKRQVYKEGSLSESADERLKRYEAVEANPELARGILTGFKELDRITNGLHKGELMIIAGDTGTGKSVVMHNIGVNAYLGSNSLSTPINAVKEDGFNVLYFSLEMPKDSIERRIDACIGQLYYNQLRDGALTAEDKEKYYRLISFQKRYQKQFYIVDMPKGATVREIELKYVEVCESYFKPDLVIVDYLGIMSVSNKTDGQDWLDLGHISAELHEFARVYEVPVITGSQVNRPKEGKTEHSTNRLARSSMVPNNANIIIQLGCRDDEDTRTDIPVYIIKMRDGEKKAFTLSKDFAKMKVIDMVDETFSTGIDDDLS